MSRRNRIIVAAAAGVAVLAAIITAAVLLTTTGPDEGGAVAAPTQEPTAVPTATPTPVLVESPYNGAMLTEGEYAEASTRLPLAVMLDNHEKARPQSGLDRADIVYEAAVEAGIPRLMAVFWSRNTDFILPVRSARTNFVEWAVELNAVYAHVGTANVPGPANSQRQIYAYGLPDLDQFVLGTEAYWRTQDRYAPYNVATTTELLWKAAAARGYVGPPQVTPWRFKDGEPAATPEVARIDVSFGPITPAGYDAAWEYDAAANRYLRLEAGAPHVDGTSGERLAADAVVVQIAYYHAAGDGTTHMLYDAIGAGEALVFQDGRVAPATWRKDTVYDRTRFFDASGQEIALNRGQIWVEVVPPGYVTYQ